VWNVLRICWIYVVNVCKMHGTHSFRVTCTYWNVQLVMELIPSGLVDSDSCYCCYPPFKKGLTDEHKMYHVPYNNYLYINSTCAWFVKLNKWETRYEYFGTRIECPLYSAKDQGFKWPPITLHVLGRQLQWMFHLSHCHTGHQLSAPGG